MKYTIPKEFYCRLHHVRPRFKNDIENVLIYMATEISKIGRQGKKKFAKAVNDATYRFPGNVTKKPKTINNWRTEISALFGFIQNNKSESWAGLRAVELADMQDLVHSFKLFLYHFQYPGGHLKPHENALLIKKGIQFKPAQFILKLLYYVDEHEKTRTGITKAELTHCVFDDLRATRDGESPDSTWERIKENRHNKIEYDWTGDVIRYAGDILDYMEIANLLVSHGQLYFVNTLEKEAILTFINSSEWFSGYDHFIKKRAVSLEKINNLQEDWFSYVNQPRPKDFFRTDILAFIAADEKEYQSLREKMLSGFEEKLETPSAVGTKEIGDVGEGLVYGHECMRMKLGSRDDLIHLIKCIPNHFAVGYDIRSVELDETHRFIEVKTTISRTELDFSKFHLTPVEWNAAESLRERYFVYRLLLTKKTKKLFMLKDPVGQYKGEKLKMSPRDGADVTFSPGICGEYSELLEWKD